MKRKVLSQDLCAVARNRLWSGNTSSHLKQNDPQTWIGARWLGFFLAFSLKILLKFRSNIAQLSLATLAFCSLFPRLFAPLSLLEVDLVFT